MWTFQNGVFQTEIGLCVHPASSTFDQRLLIFTFDKVCVNKRIRGRFDILNGRLSEGSLVWKSVIGPNGQWYNSPKVGPVILRVISPTGC